jgi:hypothetical protein
MRKREKAEKVEEESLPSSLFSVVAQTQIGKQLGQGLVLRLSSFVLFLFSVFRLNGCILGEVIFP